MGARAGCFPRRRARRRALLLPEAGGSLEGVFHNFGGGFGDGRHDVLHNVLSKE